MVTMTMDDKIRLQSQVDMLRSKIRQEKEICEQIRLKYRDSVYSTAKIKKSLKSKENDIYLLHTQLDEACLKLEKESLRRSIR